MTSTPRYGAALEVIQMTETLHTDDIFSEPLQLLLLGFGKDAGRLLAGAVAAG